jgi:chromosome segregation ATPase
MLQVAFIQNRQLVVQDAQDWLDERRHQEQLTQDRENLDSSIADLDRRIELLASTSSDIVNSIDRPNQHRAELMKELAHQHDRCRSVVLELLFSCVLKFVKVVIGS